MSKVKLFSVKDIIIFLQNFITKNRSHTAVND